MYVLILDGILRNSFNLVNEAKNFFNCCYRAIKRDIDTGRIE